MALKRRIDFLLDIDPSEKKQLNMIHPVKNVRLVSWIPEIMESISYLARNNFD